MVSSILKGGINMSKFIIQIAKKQLEKQDLISKYKYHQFTFLKGLKSVIRKMSVRTS